MVFRPNDSTSPFLTASVVLPKDQESLLIRMTTLFNDIAYKVNVREIALYSIVELVTGQKWFPNRPNFRKVIIFPVLADPGTTSIPHGITPFPTEFTNINAVITLAGTRATTLAQPEITVDAVNVNIVLTLGTYNGGSGLVTLEYLKN